MASLFFLLLMVCVIFWSKKMKRAVGTLSVHGYVVSPKMMISVLLSDALTSMKSQSWLWADETTSIPFYVNQYGQYPDLLVTKLEDALSLYFDRYLNDSVVVSVSHNASDNNPSYKLRINIHAAIDGKQYSIADEYQIKDSVISKTLNAFNGE